MAELANTLAGFYDNPYGYVMWAFPWGEGQLTPFKGPRAWQKEFLLRWGAEIKSRGFNGKDPVAPIQMATVSGHGIGKSCESAWIIKFLEDTRPFSKGVVSANTSDQLKTKTWSELGKWHNMSVTKSLFTLNASKGNMNLVNNEHPLQWRCDAMTSREENSEAFAGLHAATSTPYYLFDESSAIPEKIFQVAQGGLTDGEPMMFLFGNPTRNTGFFRQAFGRQRHRWITKQIDSRDVEGTNKKLFQEWVDDYGIDSDFVRVRVCGIFPKAAVMQLIPGDLVELALGKHIHKSVFDFAPKILGVDVAWYGDDRSVIWIRQGLAAKILFEGREVDSIDLAGMVSVHEDNYKTDATFIDAGMGNGVIDQMRRLGRSPNATYFGGKSGRPDCFNKRSEMWVNMRDWLKLYPAMPDNRDIYDDLVAPEYHMTLDGKIQLERKEAMKKRGLSSPDIGDGLALTFAQPVAAKPRLDDVRSMVQAPNMARREYDLFGDISNTDNRDMAKTKYDLFG